MSILEQLTGSAYKARIAELEAVIHRLQQKLESARNVTSPAPQESTSEPAEKRTFPTWKSFRRKASWTDKKAAAEFELNQSARRVAAAAKREEELRNGIYEQERQDVRESSIRSNDGRGGAGGEEAGSR